MDDFIVLHQPWLLNIMKRKMQIHAFKIITSVFLFLLLLLCQSNNRIQMGTTFHILRVPRMCIFRWIVLFLDSSIQDALKILVLRTREKKLNRRALRVQKSRGETQRILFWNVICKYTTWLGTLKWFSWFDNSLFLSFWEKRWNGFGRISWSNCYRIQTVRDRKNKPFLAVV